MKQTITKNGIVYCVTTVPYTAYIIQDMKRAGYKVITEGAKKEKNESSC